MRRQEADSVLLLNHVCQPADTPYRAAHAIFIREGASHQYSAVDDRSWLFSWVPVAIECVAAMNGVLLLSLLPIEWNHEEVSV
nr:DUF1203 domain-containing protein [Pseudomonas orientalis]